MMHARADLKVGPYRMVSANGFALPELLVGAALTLTVALLLARAVQQGEGAFQAQPERADMQQRLRVAVDGLTRDLLLAGAGLPTGAAAVLPFRGTDAGTGVFYRADAITAQYTPWNGAAATVTYYARRDLSTGTPQLARGDGDGGDFPMVDHVVGLHFQYFPAAELPFEPIELQDGPWLPTDTDPMKFDTDLLRVRRVRVTLRVEASLESMRGLAGSLFARRGTSAAADRLLPDQELRFDVAIRNLDDEG